MSEANLQSYLIGVLVREKLRAEAVYHEAWQSLTEVRCRIESLSNTLLRLKKDQQVAFRSGQDGRARGCRREAQGVSLMLRKEQALLVQAKRSLREAEQRLADLVGRLDTIEHLQGIDAVEPAVKTTARAGRKGDLARDMTRPESSQLT